MADANLIKKADLARAREIDLAYKFGESINGFLKVLGNVRKIPKQSGTVLKAYIADGTLENGAVAEGDVIPLSKYTTQAVTFAEIVLNKWRKGTSAEAIIERGYAQAVTDTGRKMVADVQKAIRKAFFNLLATGTTAVTGAGLQQALAQTWGKLAGLFEDDAPNTIFFVNPEDVANYLADAQILTQSAFGMKYVEDFLGMGVTFISSLVPKGKVYGTAVDNIICYYVPANGAGLEEAFDFTADETGFIGIHEEPNYTNMTSETIIASGVVFFPERLDGIVVGTIEAV